MTELTKKYWVLYEGTSIKNADYRDEQTGKCYPGEGVGYAEFDTLDELEAFVQANNLVYIEQDPAGMSDPLME
jgi:hypothetical protein